MSRVSRSDVAAIREGELLFEPSQARKDRVHMAAFIRWLGQARGLHLSSYEELWRWSVDDLAGFWSSLASFAGVPWRREADQAVIGRTMSDGRLSAEGAHWFSGAELNYVDSVLRHDPGTPALVAVDEAGGRQTMTYGELAEMASEAAAGLRALGVGRGDRVGAVLTNGIAAVSCFLATAALGATWSSCAPEFGAPSMLDRFRQIAPKVLVGQPSYSYGGRTFELEDKLTALSAGLPETRITSFDDLIRLGDGQRRLEPVSVPFEHPLWILYSSGTTGLPKSIVQGHGGIVLEHLKILLLHKEVTVGERFFWFSTTGWMMWNMLVGGLLTGSTIIAYDGNPLYPDPLALWRMAAREQVTYFGTSAPYLETCRKGGARPRDALDLSSIRSIGSTGAPLSPEGFAWASRAVADDVLVGSVSGGTDVCTAFLAACPLLPVHAGELQCAALGCDAEAFGPDGEPVTGEVGELVIRTPMPSMPLFFWGDADGSRLHRAYFGHYEGCWRHGDFVKKTERGSYVVYGRSDATLNRAGVRMGTSEFYRVAEAVEGVADALVVDTSELGREGELLLFVVPGAGYVMADLEPELRRRLREHLSPRHVPDRFVEVEELPRTLNGKKVEVPLRRVLLGSPVEEALSRDSLANPSAVDAVVQALKASGLR
jgi:acetoacetyl-CoA synthetase